MFNLEQVATEMLEEQNYITWNPILVVVCGASVHYWSWFHCPD